MEAVIAHIHSLSEELGSLYAHFHSSPPDSASLLVNLVRCFVLQTCNVMCQ